MGRLRSQPAPVSGDEEFIPCSAAGDVVTGRGVLGLFGEVTASDKISYVNKYDYRETFE